MAEHQIPRAAAGRPVKARDLQPGDTFRLRDGRRVQVMSAQPFRGRTVRNLQLWEVGTDKPNFSFTFHPPSTYHVEQDDTQEN